MARARHVALADTVVADTMAFIDSLPPGATTSLQRDIAESRPSELEAWNGAVVRMAREHGTPDSDPGARLRQPPAARAPRPRSSCVSLNDRWPRPGAQGSVELRAGADC
ncbi:MAG: ketopantoate reductase C-terminal domain-containing protein [bacterium]